MYFYSSRRGHTIFKCDWSSDVCSSDLYVLGLGVGLLQNLDDVLQGLARLPDEIIGDKLRFTIPSNHAAHKNHLSFCGNAVGVALGAGPVSRPQDFSALLSLLHSF